MQTINTVTNVNAKNVLPDQHTLDDTRASKKQVGLTPKMVGMQKQPIFNIHGKRFSLPPINEALPEVQQSQRFLSKADR